MRLQYWRHLSTNRVLEERTKRKYKNWHNSSFWLLWVILAILAAGFLR